MFPFFLKEGSIRQFESATRSGSSALNGVDDWPSSVNWLLVTYATNQSIHRAVEYFRNISQREDELDLEYYNRFEEAHAKCGDYLQADQLIPPT